VNTHTEPQCYSLVVQQLANMISMQQAKSLLSNMLPEITPGPQSSNQPGIAPSPVRLGALAPPFLAAGLALGLAPLPVAAFLAAGALPAAHTYTQNN
jgi:hypothetical protein